MKKYFLTSLLILTSLAARPVILAASSHSSPSPAAKECSDCGCNGPASDGTCGMEKGKTCHCKK